RPRVVIENVQPEVQAGRFPAKRTAGDTVTVEADVFADGHDEISAVLLHRKEGAPAWDSFPMTPLGNDRWQARFYVPTLGRYRFTGRAWVDPFKTWRRALRKRLQAGQDVSVDLLIGAELVSWAADRATGPDAERLHGFLRTFSETALREEQAQVLLDDDLFRF